MKIALITIHNVTNYGAILQAYATKEVLSKFGEVKIINYQKKHLSSHMDLVRFEMSVHGMKRLVHDLLNFFARRKLISKFKNFIQSSFDLTSKIHDNQDFNDELGDFDLYVCGSDQIWNPSIVSSSMDLDPIYFLSFAPKGAAKISYASSIGHHYFNDAEEEVVQKLLKDFRHISIREEDGKQKLLKIFPRMEIDVVLDPTLLLSKTEWLHKFGILESINPHEKYILVYSVPRTELIRKAINYFSKKLGYKVYSIDKMLLPLTKVDKHINDADPIDFIKLFSNASFVITDSFHGLCFAINFEIPFVAVSSNKVGNRQENLLALLGINEEDALARSETDFDKIPLNLEFNSIRKKLEFYREKSMNYLENSVTD